MHGGLSPDLNSMEQIRRVMRPTDVSLLFSLSCQLSARRERARALADNYRFLTAVFSAISCGLIQIKISPAGVKTIEVSPSLSDPMLSLDSYKSMTWT